MLQLMRLQARALRSLFRRSVLGIRHRGSIPPLVLRFEDSQLRAQYRYGELALECRLPLGRTADGAVAIPFEALDYCASRDETWIEFQTPAPGTTLLAWQDRGIPQTRSCVVDKPERWPAWPEIPDRFETNPPAFLAVLAAAVDTTELDPVRYATDCVRLCGKTGAICATDGRQLLLQRGFRFPWEGDLLVPRSPLFRSKDMPHDQPVQVGRTESHVVLRFGILTVALAIRTEARFPNTDSFISGIEAPATRLLLDPEDRRVLAHTLDRLPGAEDPTSPVTLDCAEQVAVRAGARETEQATELVLGRSRYVGEPLRIATNRQYLERALRFGFEEIHFTSPESPIVCKAPDRVYVWQPLSAELAVERSEQVQRVDSSSTRLNGIPTTPETKPVQTNANGSAKKTRSNHPPAHVNGRPAEEPVPATGLAALVAQAESLHTSLSEAKSKTRELIKALRRHRRSSRRVAGTLASLRQIPLQEVAS